MICNARNDADDVHDRVAFLCTTAAAEQPPLQSFRLANAGVKIPQHVSAAQGLNADKISAAGVGWVSDRSRARHLGRDISSAC